MIVSGSRNQNIVEPSTSCQVSKRPVLVVAVMLVPWSVYHMQYEVGLPSYKAVLL